MNTKGIKEAIQAAILAVFGRSGGNGFVASSARKEPANEESNVIPFPAQQSEKFDMQGIPEDRRDEVTVQMTAALVNGRSITPKEAYAAQEASWKRSNAASLESAIQDEKFAVEFLGRTQLDMEEFNWGCIYKGTREQFISAGLADAEKFAKLKKLPKSKRDEGLSYFLPLNWQEQYYDRCYSGKYQMFDPMPPRFDADLRSDESDTFKLYVHKGEIERDDKGIRERTEKALDELRKTAPNMDHLAELVRAIPTQATWIQVPWVVKAAEEFAKAQDEEKDK